MLYLIRSFGRGNKTSLKIGYTNNIQERFSHYYIHNPFYEPIATREGTLEDELKLHLYLEVLGYKQSFLDEWFVDEDEVQQIFHMRIEKADSVLWRYREGLFTVEDFKDNSVNSLKYNLFNYLWNKYTPEIKQQKDIDRFWLFENSKRNLRKCKRELESMYF